MPQAMNSVLKVSAYIVESQAALSAPNLIIVTLVLELWPSSTALVHAQMLGTISHQIPIVSHVRWLAAPNVWMANLRTVRLVRILQLYLT